MSRQSLLQYVLDNQTQVEKNIREHMGGKAPADLTRFCNWFFSEESRQNYIKDVLVERSINFYPGNPVQMRRHLLEEVSVQVYHETGLRDIGKHPEFQNYYSTLN